MSFVVLGIFYRGKGADARAVMNLSHIIHEFSFGPYFPAIAQPLDMTYTITEQREPPSANSQLALSCRPS